MDKPLDDKPINRLLSVVASLVFAPASFYAIGSLFASYFENPFYSLNGEVKEIYGLIRKIRTSDKESLLVAQKTNKASSKRPFYPNDTTYVTTEELDKTSNWKRAKKKEVDFSISKYSWKDLESLDRDKAQLQQEP